MGFSKKHGKNRLDKYYHMAKEQGFRARSAFKLVQLNKKYGFLEKSKCVVDLCAAPGGWCQVASKYMPSPSLIIGIDLVPIKPIPNVITLVHDITTAECRAALRQEMKHFKADAFLHDGAPNVGKSWVHDAFAQNELTLSALKVAVEFLIPNGVFVTKVFRSKDYNKLMWVFQQLFERVEATKPAASRNVSAEIFVVCSGFKAPKSIDPQLLDPKYVFKDVEADQQEDKRQREDQSKLLNSLFSANRQRRFRDGYEDGNYTLFKTETVYNFLTTSEPVSLLSSCSQITPYAAVKASGVSEASQEEELSLKAWNHPLTKSDIQVYFSDLKLLGRREFKDLLRWRETMRHELGLIPAKSADNTEVAAAVAEPVNFVDELYEKSTKAEVLEKRERKKKREKRAKELQRLQMGMEAPLDIGIEASQNAEFGASVFVNDYTDSETSGGEIEDNSEYIDRLEQQADRFYGKVIKRDAKSEKQKPIYEEWEGFDKELDKDDASAGGSESEDLLESGSELELLDSENDKVPLSKKAERLFSNEIFKDEDCGPIVRPVKARATAQSDSESDYESMRPDSDAPKDKNGFELVQPAEYDPSKDKFAITTAELYSLAQKAVTTSGMEEIINDGFNKRTFNDNDGLPDWFLDDERKHNRLNKPITKEAAEHIKQQMKAINARPIKKIAEAKGRKKLRALRRVQSLQKKMGQVVEDEDMSGNSKSTEMRKLLEKARRASGNKNKKVEVVVARGHNRAVKGRPKGVKGRYKMVDSRGKKELRAEKRKAKAQKKRRH